MLNQKKFGSRKQNFRRNIPLNVNMLKKESQVKTILLSWTNTIRPIQCKWAISVFDALFWYSPILSVHKRYLARGERRKCDKLGFSSPCILQGFILMTIFKKLQFVNQICQQATFQQSERYAASEMEKCSRQPPLQ